MLSDFTSSHWGHIGYSDLFCKKGTPTAVFIGKYLRSGYMWSVTEQQGGPAVLRFGVDSDHCQRGAGWSGHCRSQNTTTISV